MASRQAIAVIAHLQRHSVVSEFQSQYAARRMRVAGYVVERLGGDAVERHLNGGGQRRQVQLCGLCQLQENPGTDDLCRCQ